MFSYRLSKLEGIHPKQPQKLRNIITKCVHDTLFEKIML